MKGRIVALLLIGVAALLYLRSRPLTHPPGVLVAEAPLQQDLDEPAEPFRHLDFSITPVARFEVRARVLGRRDYRSDPVARLSPVDLALGWGAMSDQQVIDRMKFRQGNRFYHYRYRLPAPIPAPEIISSSANMHMVPASEEIARALRSTRAGQIVSLAGYLINVRGDDGGTWVTSRTRTDSGRGACEIVWVERFEIE